MKLLLDTHVFLWFISGDSRLSTSWTDAIRKQENEVYLSAVSCWEVIIKHALGKLPLPEPPDTYIPIQRARHQIESCPLDEDSIRHLATLPQAHQDPFDRALVCQALEHELVIVNVDKVFLEYPAPIFDSGPGRKSRTER